MKEEVKKLFRGCWRHLSCLFAPMTTFRPAGVTNACLDSPFYIQLTSLLHFTTIFIEYSEHNCVAGGCARLILIVPLISRWLEICFTARYFGEITLGWKFTMSDCENWFFTRKLQFRSLPSLSLITNAFSVLGGLRWKQFPDFSATVTVQS